jgi:outer membrane protein OmpA-like peptidoglycan-associated protein|uniref:Type IV secretion system putative outer membrane lipoprotein n=3 Tax=root TaxID=1 RepID=A0A899NED5_ECOLX|nr:Type IV secretion system putative outer membrane lipoprotein [Sym plasmid]QSM61603.1 Type IV secretion system putative outer membrane lipoprotein [Escherichia coli]
MRKAFFLAFSLASMIFAQGAMATDYGSAAGTPISSMVMVSFPDSSTTFQPPVDVAAVLDDARTASMIYINGRTSTNRPSARDEALALKRALSARKYLVDRGVSPLKVMVNFASAADYVTENITPEGRYQNQRVEIELVYVPMF